MTRHLRVVNSAIRKPRKRIKVVASAILAAGIIAATAGFGTTGGDLETTAGGFGGAAGGFGASAGRFGGSRAGIGPNLNRATFANWRDQTRFTPAAITAGDFGLTRNSDSQFYRLDHNGATTLIAGAELTRGDLVTPGTLLFPGDTIAAVRDASLKLDGGNLIGRLRIQFDSDPCPAGNIFHWAVRAYQSQQAIPLSNNQVRQTSTVPAHGVIAYFTSDPESLQDISGVPVHLASREANIRVLVTATIDEAARYVGTKAMPAARLVLEQVRAGSGFATYQDDLSAWAGQPDQINPARCAVS
ncbi:MAG: hypothetical protein LBB58_06940 [Cellulomonadaceae bacterium]|jgi:hypothetical protein|nr:hypothetical protein [Cellulomonadaceae bacterium]